MKIVLVEPGKQPKEQEIDGRLETMQRLVGGYIQVLYPFEEHIALVCNDEAKLEGLPTNRGLWDENGKLYDIICGPFFLCGAPADSENFASLTPEETEKFKERFRKPEMFLNICGCIVCVPVEG